MHYSYVQATRMAGLSLIELMIALLLGVILTLGATQVFLGTSQSYRLTDGVAHAQETIRFATSMMQRDVRSAGSLACLQSASDVDIKLNGGTIVPLEQGINGWEADDTSSGDTQNFSITKPEDASSWSEGGGSATFPEELEGAVVGGTDILIVNSVETVPVGVTGESTGQIDMESPSGVPQERVVLSVDGNCSGGELFQKANQPTAPSVTMAGSGADPGNQPGSGFELSYNTDAKIAEFSTKAYYVGIGSSGEPALFMQRLGSVPEAPEELVEGVESMQVLYGISTNLVRQADQYVSADAVTDWSQVMSVRVAYIVRSGTDANSEDVTRTFNLLGTEVTAPTDRRARLLASTTIGLRNRLE